MLLKLPDAATLTKPEPWGAHVPGMPAAGSTAAAAAHELKSIAASPAFASLGLDRCPPELQHPSWFLPALPHKLLALAELLQRDLMSVTALAVLVHTAVGYSAHMLSQRASRRTTAYRRRWSG